MADVLAFGFLLSILLGFVFVAQYWSSSILTLPPIDLSFRSLPHALFLSLSRIFLAYVVSLISSLIVGYWAAHSKMAERIFVPLIDIGQSVPVLVFLPPLVLGFLAIFPHSRTGLEIAAILTLYTGMAWNMMLSFYGSIKTIPREYVEIIRAYGYGPLGRLLRLELPYAMNGLVWNSMLSVAGGWYFLTVCESYTLGERSYQLTGLGSFMSVAADKADYVALSAGGGLMLVLLALTDYFVWNPLLKWSERFQRMDPITDEEDEEPVLNFFAKSERLTHLIRKFRRRYAVRLYVVQRRGKKAQRNVRWDWIGYGLVGLFVLASVWGIIASLHMVSKIPLSEWTYLLRAAFYSFLRVNLALLLSTILMIPLGLWMGSKPKLVKKLKPFIQVVAAFPAPMVFPLLMFVFIPLHIPLSVGSVIFVMAGAQWYLLFNVISGTASVPENFIQSAQTMGMSGSLLMRKVYLPATYPQILTGLITAAGGAWNSTIVAEIVNFNGKEYITEGLGSYIAKAASQDKFSELIASVTVMVIVIVLLNRFFWARLYELVESKYRLDR